MQETTGATVLATNVATALQMLGVIGSGFAWFYQAQATGLQNKIKTHLSLLKDYRELFPAPQGVADPHAELMEDMIKQLIDRAYRDKSVGEFHPVDLVIGLAALAGFFASGWNALHAHPGTWQRIAEMGASAFLGLMALGGFLNAFNVKTSRSGPTV